MSKQVICVTNRHLCKGDFLEQIEKISLSGVDKIVLREKDLSPEDYLILADKVLNICSKNSTECVQHNFIDVAKKLNYNKIHLPLHILQKHSEDLKNFKLIGCSTHSQIQANDAIKYGANYIFCGHIFKTDCKKDLEPRGLEFLNSICKESHIPVFAIGGINESNAHLAFENGASGVCLMSELMISDNPDKIVSAIKK